MSISNDHPEPGSDRRTRADQAAAQSEATARSDDEAGSLVTEYGLLAVVAATVCGVVIQWASGGAIVRLFNGLLNAARDLVGA